MYANVLPSGEYERPPNFGPEGDGTFFILPLLTDTRKISCSSVRNRQSFSLSERNTISLPSGDQQGNISS